MSEPNMPSPDLSQAENVVCARCGNYTFEQVFLMLKVSAIMSPNGKAGVAPVPTFACVACGNVNREFLPVVPKDEQETVSEDTPAKPKLVLEN